MVCACLEKPSLIQKCAEHENYRMLAPETHRADVGGRPERRLKDDWLRDGLGRAACPRGMAAVSMREGK